MKSGLKDIRLESTCADAGVVATIAAMKSGLKGYFCGELLIILMGSNHCRDEKRTERRPTISKQTKGGYVATIAAMKSGLKVVEV